MTSLRTTDEFHLDGDTYAALVEHARSDHPYEVCGLLAGRDGQVLGHYRIPNATRSMTHYTMDAVPLLHAMNDIDDRGWDLLAIYHSHTHTEAYPSATDVQLAAYSDAVYLIVSLQDPDAPEVRAFDIVDRTVTERELLLDGGPRDPGLVDPAR